MKRKMSHHGVCEQLTALPDMGLAELRQLWTQCYRDPPGHRAPDLLRRVLAWRIQADTYGGLDSVTVRLLGNERTTLTVAEQPGTRLAREYAGKKHEVVIVEGGVLYNDAQYGSLSEVARAITGQRWNGPRFFGLRQGKAP